MEAKKTTGRPRKSPVGSEKWIAGELAVAEQRLRTIRKQIRGANPEELPRLLRLETMLRREVERLARAAQTQVPDDVDELLRELRALEEG
jgi:hypothetical protein